MSTNKNPDSMTAAQGEFSSKIAPSAPMTTKGHAAGVMVGNDKVPEFNAETYPPGTAPKENTFQPDSKSEIPGQALNPDMQSATSASDTIAGATSGDMHQGIGLPGSGMTSKDTRGGSGLEGVGANSSDQKGRDQNAGGPGDGGHGGKARSEPVDYVGAENMVPATAEDVASERP